MRDLKVEETENVSGGWDWVINLGFVEVSGDGGDVSDAYNWAVDRTADFFTWWDPMNYYEGRC